MAKIARKVTRIARAVDFLVAEPRSNLAEASSYGAGDFKSNEKSRSDGVFAKLKSC